MNEDCLVYEVDRKRKYYCLSKQALSTFLGINSTLLRDVLYFRKKLPQKYNPVVKDFIEMTLDDFLNQHFNRRNNNDKNVQI